MAIKVRNNISYYNLNQAKMVEANQNKLITTAEFAAKFRSKYEVYQFLTIDALAYLPPPECVTMYFLKDLVRGIKKCK